MQRQKWTFRRSIRVEKDPGPVLQGACKSHSMGGMSYRRAADILLDLVQASAIASVVPDASSPHPCSLIDWNKGKSLCFYPIFKVMCWFILLTLFYSFSTE